jgi:hypothetical protein
MNAELLRCWFCGESPDANSALTVTLFKRTSNSQTGGEAGELPIPVPRCAECARRHQLIDVWSTRIGVTAGLALFAVAVVKIWNSSYHFPSRLKGFLLIGVPATLGILILLLSKALFERLLLKGGKTSDSAVAHPTVVAALADGWKRARPEPPKTGG